MAEAAAPIAEIQVGVGTVEANVLIAARELRKVYGEGAAERIVLDGVNLEINAGEMIALIGPSGSGKSTLLHLLGALDTPTSGTIYFHSKALKTLTEEPLAGYRNRAMGF